MTVKLLFFLGCCFQDLFKAAHTTFIWFLSSLFSKRFVRVSVVHQYSNMETALKKSRFTCILSDKPDFHRIDNLSIAFWCSARRIQTLFSVDEMLLPSYVILVYWFLGLPLRVEMAPFHLKHMYSVLFTFTLRTMTPIAYSTLCNWIFTWTGVFVWSTRASALSVSVIISVGCRLLLAFF